MILHLVESEKLKFKNGCLYVVTSDNEVLIDLSQFEAIVIDTTQISITSSALLFATEQKVPIIFCNHKHMPQAFCFDIYMHYKTCERINKQMLWNEDKKELLWKEIIKEKIIGQRNNLIELDKDNDIINSLNGYVELLDIDNYEVNIQEAISARLYFKAMFGNEFIRQNDDIVNAGLNYGYSLLRSYISCLITAKGLHPSIGLSHHSIFNNYNFADDIIEIFRPMVDVVVHEQIKYHDEFNKELRVELLNILTKTVFYGDQEVSFKRAINLFLDNIINYFEDDTELLIPRLEEAYAVR